MSKRLIIALILFVVTIAGKLLIDLLLYFNGGENNHLVGPAIVIVSIGVSSWLAGWRSIPMWLFGYWAVFDSLYGLFIGHGLLYIGTTAMLDVLQRDHPWIQVTKYVLAVASTIFYVVFQRPILVQK